MSITLKNTKAELYAEVQRLTKELAHAQFQATTALKQLVAVAQEVVAKPVVQRAPIPQWQELRLAAMQAARAQAMNSNSVVKV